MRSQSEFLDVCRILVTIYKSSRLLRSIMSDSRIQACSCCGLVQFVALSRGNVEMACCRCGTAFRRFDLLERANSRAAALTVAALVLYPLAVGLPIMRIEKFGHFHDSSILQGTATLFQSGHIVIALIIFICSIVLPVGKLIALLTLAIGAGRLPSRHRALTYRVVEWTGRWGMLDVLLVAIVVAAVKIGDLVQVTVGSAALAFASCVVLSLAATATFDPHQFWQPIENGENSENIHGEPTSLQMNDGASS